VTLSFLCPWYTHWLFNTVYQVRTVHDGILKSALRSRFMKEYLMDCVDLVDCVLNHKFAYKH